MKLEFSAGGIVFKRGPKGPFIAFILDPFGKWTFPKGHIEKGEKTEVAALREAMEETGMKNLRLIGFLGKTDIWFRRPKGLIHKFIYFYLMEAPVNVKIRPQKEEKIRKVKWVEIAKALNFSDYKDVRVLLKLAVKKIRQILKIKINDLEQIGWKIRECKRCSLWKRASSAVPGEGDQNAKIMFLGEAPGEKEDQSGLPFVGRSGRFLDVLLKKAGLDRKRVFITSVLKHRPPNNRKPNSGELNACRIWWKKQMEIINPKIVILLGWVAYKEILQKNDFAEKRGKITEKDGRIYFPTYHPAAALRFPKFKKTLFDDFHKIKSIIKL
jgi:uracil-DNA glycosylase family 4